MSGFEERRAAFEKEGATIIAGSVDSLEKTTDLAADKGYRFAYGMTREDGEVLDAWYQEQRKFIQPAEFLLSQSGTVLFSSYSDGPIGRMDATETLSLIRYLNEQKQKS